MEDMEEVRVVVLRFRYVGGSEVGKSAMQGTMDKILSEIVKMNGGWRAIQAIHFYLEDKKVIIEIVKKRRTEWYEYEVIGDEERRIGGEVNEKERVA